jgi:hypothetical protein
MDIIGTGLDLAAFYDCGNGKDTIETRVSGKPGGSPPNGPRALGWNYSEKMNAIANCASRTSACELFRSDFSI